MAKSFGDAMIIDLKTREIRCLTCNVPAAVFLRVMHLVTGDYILIGPDHFENIRVSRTRDNELWFPYGEVEGIFSDGLYAAVEADRQCEQLGGPAAPKISTSGN